MLGPASPRGLGEEPSRLGDWYCKMQSAPANVRADWSSQQESWKDESHERGGEGVGESQVSSHTTSNYQSDDVNDFKIHIIISTCVSLHFRNDIKFSLQLASTSNVVGPPETNVYADCLPGPLEIPRSLNLPWASS